MNLRQSYYRLPEGVRHTMLMTGGTMAATGLSAAAGILLSRTLGPVGFGEFSVGLSLAFILAKVNDLGLVPALLKFVPVIKTQEKINHLFSYTIKVKLITGVIIWLVGWLITPLIIYVLRFENPAIIYLAFLLNLITVAFEQLAAMLQSLRRVKQAVAASTIQAMVKILMAVYLFVGGPAKALTAFCLYITAPISAVVVAGKLLPSWVKLNLAGPFAKERELLTSAMGHFLIFTLSFGLVDNMDILMVQGLLSGYDTGLYSGASRIAMFVVMSAYAVAAVINPRVARYSDRRDIKAYFKKAGWASLVIMIGVGALLPFASLLIRLTIGEAYIGAWFALILLLLAGGLSLANALFIAPFFSFAKGNRFFSVYGVMQVVVLVGATLILIPLFGLAGAAWARVATKGLMLVMVVVWGGWKIYGREDKASELG